MNFVNGSAALSALLASLSLAAVVSDGSWSAHADRFVAIDHPAAVLAWAKLRCDPDLKLGSNLARVDAEDLRSAVSAFDSAARYRSTNDLCAEAMTYAQR